MISVQKHIPIGDRSIVRGIGVHNHKNMAVKIPLHKIFGIAGVSGCGKSSLALGGLYAGKVMVSGEDARDATELILRICESAKRD